MKYHLRFPLLFALLFSSLLANSATAQVTLWQVGNHNWFNTDNWTNGVPDASSMAVISNGGKAQILSYDAVADLLQIGSADGSTGFLEILSGSLTAPLSYMGMGTGSNGTAWISGGQWDSLQLSVGVAGNATLEISGSGKVIASTAVSIAANASSTGLVKISGGSLISDDMLDVGVHGNGTLEITGGAVSNDRGSIGRESGSIGLTKISGGTWTNSGYLDVGEFGNGTLEISGTGKVTNTYASIGRESGSTGLAKISSGEWVSTYFDVGNKGSGTLEISGGIVRNDGGVIAREKSSNGTVKVSGGQWINNGNLFVGNLGMGNMQISGTGAVSNQAGIVAGNAGAWGTVSVTGGSWTNSGDLTIGRGNNTLAIMSISGNGSVSNASGWIGYGAGSYTGAEVISGTWTNSRNLTVGVSGDAVLSLQGGTVRVDGDIANSGSGTVYIATNSGSTGTLDFGAYDLTSSAGNLIATAIAFGAGNGTINFNQTDFLEITQTITGNGKLIQRGSGTTLLSGTGTHTGGTEVHKGTLLVNGTFTASAVTVHNGGTLGGSGTLGNIALESGGILAPGNSIGILTAASLEWNSDATLLFELGAGENDRLTLGGAFQKSGLGAFDFTFLDDGWQVGETYSLVSFGNTDFLASDFNFTNASGFDGIFAISGNTLTFQLLSVPEPSLSLLLALALLCLTACRRRTR